MIAPPALVLVEQQVDVARLDITALKCSRFGQRAAHAFPQLLIYPLVNRDAEPLLRTIQDFGWHEVTHRLLEDMLGFESLHLHPGRNPRADKFYQLVIEQGRTRFQ